MSAKAQEIWEDLLPIQRRVLGPEHPVTLATMNNLALAYLDHGQLAGAQELLDKILPIQQRGLGSQHPGTLNTMQNLANTYLGQGNPAEAQKRYEELLSLRRRVLGPEHPDTLRTMHNLAIVCSGTVSTRTSRSIRRSCSQLRFRWGPRPLPRRNRAIAELGC